MTAQPLNDLLNCRYATKKMDSSKAVPQDKVDAIIEAIRMAPTSSGTQPFKLFVVTNPDIRSKIAEAAGGQAQITDGSHLLVFAAWDKSFSLLILWMFFETRCCTDMCCMAHSKCNQRHRL
jgi:nitroreductase / dihydropteridine reductase